MQQIITSQDFLTEDEIQKFRDETSGTRKVIHLNNAGAGLMPDIVTKAQIDHLKLESEIGGYEAAAKKFDEIADFYTSAALFFNCEKKNIAFTSSATDSFSRALSSIPFQAQDIILTDRDNFVSNQIQFLSLQKKFNIQIIHINNAPVGGIDLNDFEQKLNTLQPKLLAITHIPTSSGLVQPVKQIAEIFGTYSEKHPEKTWYILDVCQSAGQMKVDVKALRCDFLSLTGRKYLRGPRGTGILYVSNKVLQAGLEPLFVDMRGAEWVKKDKYQQQPDAKRFEDWEFAYSTVLGTRAAIKYCSSIGEDRIWNRIKLLADFTREKLVAINRLKLMDKGLEKGGAITFNIEKGDPDFIIHELSKRNINVVASYRAYGLIDFDEKGIGWVIRASVHYYNTHEEIEFFIDALAEILKK